MITAGRLLFAFGKARTAVMPLPYLIILGVIPLSFFTAIMPPGRISIDQIGCKFCQAYPRLRKRVKAKAIQLVSALSATYISNHELQGRIERSGTSDEHMQQ